MNALHGPEETAWRANAARHRDWWLMPARERQAVLRYEAGYDDGWEDGYAAGHAAALAGLLRVLPDDLLDRFAGWAR